MAKHPALRAVAVAGTLAGAAVVLSRRYIPVKVAGPSMLPTLHPGDQLVVDTRAAVRAGDIVVARRVDGLEIVKRAAEVDDGGSVWLVGDNAAMSADSRTFGAGAAERIVGVVRCVYWPPPRWRIFKGTRAVATSSRSVGSDV